MTSETVEAVEVALGRFALARGPVRRVVLAVSGGPDSLALLLAFAGRPPTVEVCVATVDHRLRPEAAGEAAFVAAVCRELGLPHRTLVWREGAGATGNLMAAAREARYGLLVKEAARVGAQAIMAAHHRDDQIETHLLARERGASGAALAGMRPWRDLEPGLLLLRPFLDLPKAALIGAVAHAGLEAVADPGNRDLRFRRANLRAQLAQERHDLRAIARAMADAATLRREVDDAAAETIRRACGDARLDVDAAGVARLRPTTGDLLPWSRLLTGVGGGLHPPASGAVDRLATRFASEGKGVVTLGGCRVEGGRDGIVFMREFGRSGPAGVAVGTSGPIVFDRRFTISSAPGRADRRIEALGRLGRGGISHRTLPVLMSPDGGVLAVHPALSGRFPELPPLAAIQRIGWRIWADLPGEPPERLTAQPQNAANPVKAVGKDLAATYLRGRVKVRAP